MIATAAQCRDRVEVSEEARARHALSAARILALREVVNARNELPETLGTMGADRCRAVMLHAAEIRRIVAGRAM